MLLYFLESNNESADQTLDVQAGLHLYSSHVTKSAFVKRWHISTLLSIKLQKCNIYLILLSQFMMSRNLNETKKILS